MVSEAGPRAVVRAGELEVPVRVISLRFPYVAVDCGENPEVIVSTAAAEVMDVGPLAAALAHEVGHLIRPQSPSWLRKATTAAALLGLALLPVAATAGAAAAAALLMVSAIVAWAILELYDEAQADAFAAAAVGAEDIARAIATASEDDVFFSPFRWIAAVRIALVRRVETAIGSGPGTVREGFVSAAETIKAVARDTAVLRQPGPPAAGAPSPIGPAPIPAAPPLRPMSPM